MPLRDHFRSPVNDSHTWGELHGIWPAEIVRQLTTLLPTGYRAGPNLHLGSPFAVDVSTYNLDSRDPDAPAQGGTATLTALAPTLTVETEFADQDEFEVRVYDAERGRQLVAAIEIVSPSNKDRPEARDLFAGKVGALLQQGVSVTLVDLVTIRQASLYAAVLDLYGRSDPALGPTPPPLYAVTLRTRKPLGRRGRRPRPRLDAWFYPMAVGQPLPTVPLWLTEELRVMLPLDTSYEETCRVLQIA